ncbi:MAG: sel1 repeat family protein [Acidobacteria bacterium]|nr:sel1 repeat family protein [Acidobacteriota bacterium]
MTRFTLLILLASIAAADFDAGRMAYDRGDYAAALREWRPLAETSEPRAQWGMGLIYVLGKGVPQDHAEALKWFRLSAEQGYAPAAYELGVMYAHAEGVPQDYAQAMKWYRIAAKQGLSGAQNNIGVMYYNGQGVSRDFREAAKWYRRAAGRGYAHAQRNLGKMYAAGEGVSRDPVQAYTWLTLSMARGEKSAAAERQALAGGMTPANIAKAEQRAAAWKPSSLPGSDLDSPEVFFFGLVAIGLLAQGMVYRRRQTEIPFFRRCLLLYRPPGPVAWVLHLLFFAMLGLVALFAIGAVVGGLPDPVETLHGSLMLLAVMLLVNAWAVSLGKGRSRA